MIPADPMAELGPATIIRGDARNLPLPDNSVDLIVTSPPYFNLRSYTDGGQHYGGQIGSEPTPTEFVDALLECTVEMARVLKPSGSIFVNLGDKYSSGSGGQSHLTALGARLGTGGGQKQGSAKMRSPASAGFPPKTLLGMPWRYALRCIDELGLILRAEIIWSKPNGLPESVTDRVRRSHEQWFHFTTQPRYFAATDEIREPHTGHNGNDIKASKSSNSGNNHRALARDESLFNPLGKLPGSVREVPSSPLKVPAHLEVDHFAAFPPAWPAWIIRGWSPAGICTACDEPRRPVTDVQYLSVGDTFTGGTATAGRHRSGARMGDGSLATITGYGCACAEPTEETRPAVVLDPFGGTGTTAMAARALGRHGITVDLSADYCRLARWRCADLDQLRAVRGIPKPARPAITAHELTLFDGEAAS